jgi:hypothetical protein
MASSQYARNVIFDVLNVSHPQSLKSSHPSFPPLLCLVHCVAKTEALLQKVDLKEVCTESSLRTLVSADVEIAI